MTGPTAAPSIVTVTFDDGGVVDTETFGPFATQPDASAWADQFFAWWRVNAKAGSRTVRHVTITRLSDPWFVTTQPLPETSGSDPNPGNNVTVHILRHGKAACGSPATKALTERWPEVTCQRCKRTVGHPL